MPFFERHPLLFLYKSSFHFFLNLYSLMFSSAPGPIGIFDSGYGGLTIFDKIREAMPAYDYIYLGDNARTPYGPRSFEVVYRFTKQAVETLFHEGCQMVILACNTASAKALRTIQQNDLPQWDPQRRVLGVIRPTVELMDQISRTKHIGILGTNGTISSGSYAIEIEKMFPHITVTGEACPMWVPLVENNEFNTPGADYFVQKHLEHILALDPQIDTLVLGCTHYPLLMDKIRSFLPQEITVFAQGEYVASSLVDYLKRHPEMDERLTKQGKCRFLTTESASKFSEAASVFLSHPVEVEQISID
jgi:glutamate racemase